MRGWSSGSGEATSGFGTRPRAAVDVGLGSDGIGGGSTLLILAVYSGANVLAALPPGALIMAITMVIALSAVAAAVDRAHGPLPSTARDSRRRGTVIGLGTFAVVFLLTVAAGQFPFYQLWIAPVGAVAYLVIAGLQWSRQTRSAQQLS